MRDSKEIIKAMLTERVAHSMGDSGGAYGYKHDANEGRDFENEDEVTVDLTYINKGDSSKCIDYSISVYHYLTKVLEFNEFTEEVNNALLSARAYLDEEGNEDTFEYPHWSQECMSVVENLIENDIEVGETYNTCNGDSNLDQVLQYTPFVYEDTHYIMLQVHGGCDVRGGYTDAVCFTIEDFYGCEMATLPIEDVYGDVDGEPCSNSYDGYSITSDGDESQGEEMELKFNDDGECVSEVSLYLMEH